MVWNFSWSNAALVMIANVVVVVLRRRLKTQVEPIAEERARVSSEQRCFQFYTAATLVRPEYKSNRIILGCHCCTWLTGLIPKTGKPRKPAASSPLVAWRLAGWRSGVELTAESPLEASPWAGLRSAASPGYVFTRRIDVGAVVVFGGWQLPQSRLVDSPWAIWPSADRRAEQTF